MKKTFLFACAAIAASLSFTSCSDEVDMFEKASKTATIDLNITNDDAMVTRAITNVPDAPNWYITVGTNAQIQVSNLSSQKYEAGSYNITVSNYTNEAAAINANNAYYTGTLNNQNLNKGNNELTVACGKAQNCRVVADLAGLNDLTTISDAKLTVKQANVTDRELNGTTTTGYFYAGTGKTINYQLDYKYNGNAATALTGSISDPAAATEYQVKVVTNSNGTITLTITYDTEFTTQTAETITIDAATGEKANS